MVCVLFGVWGGGGGGCVGGRVSAVCGVLCVWCVVCGACSHLTVPMCVGVEVEGGVGWFGTARHCGTC